MSSSLILVFVNVFSFNMSSTHIIFSALTLNAIVWLPDDFVNYWWLSFEFLVWMTAPLFAIMTSNLTLRFINQFVLHREGSIYRMVTFIPYQIASTAAFMIIILVTKDLSDDEDRGSHYIIYIRVSVFSVVLGLICGGFIFFFTLIGARFYLMRRGRRSKLTLK
jgi:hypothetical protein